MVVEGADGGATAVGPLFRDTHRGCCFCYIARRRANGAKECRPASTVSDCALDVVDQEIELIASGQSRLSAEQVVVSADGTVHRHIFLSIPNCPICAERSAQNRVNGCLDLVGDRLGLVHEVTRIGNVIEPLVGAVALGCRTDALWPNRASNRGMAVDDHADRARHRAIGESIERYCAACIPDDLLAARPADLAGVCLLPSRFGSIHAKWAEAETVIRWVSARTLKGNRHIWVPASAVYIPYPGENGETVLDPQSSVGLAAHKSLDGAIRHALCEIIERDASLRAWRFGLPVEAVPNGVVSFPELPGLHFTRVPSESGLYVVATFIECTERPFTSTGLAARPTLTDAARHAAHEAVLSQLWLREWLTTYGTESYATPARTMIDNAVAHAVRADLRSVRDRWFNGREAAEAGRSRSWQSILSELPNACYVELTTPDVAAAGLHVVRVLIPDKVLADDDCLRPRLGGDPTPHPFG
jgi:ribosomal protein S12 methylthiotransferase accessory factor